MIATVGAAGVGDDVDNQELRALASSPADQHVFMVHSYSALTYIKDMLAIETCKGKFFFYNFSWEKYDL